MLQIDDSKFWKLSPKVLKELLDVHSDVNSGESKRKKKKNGWSKQPEAYIDQVL